MCDICWDQKAMRVLDLSDVLVQITPDCSFPFNDRDVGVVAAPVCP